MADLGQNPFIDHHRPDDDKRNERDLHPEQCVRAVLSWSPMLPSPTRLGSTLVTSIAAQISEFIERDGTMINSAMLMESYTGRQIERVFRSAVLPAEPARSNIDNLTRS
jgi:hypothetical protein